MASSGSMSAGSQITDTSFMLPPPPPAAPLPAAAAERRFSPSKVAILRRSVETVASSSATRASAVTRLAISACSVPAPSAAEDCPWEVGLKPRDPGRALFGVRFGEASGADWDCGCLAVVAPDTAVEEPECKSLVCPAARALPRTGVLGDFGATEEVAGPTEAVAGAMGAGAGNERIPAMAAPFMLEGITVVMVVMGMPKFGLDPYGEVIMGWPKFGLDPYGEASLFPGANSCGGAPPA
mmetsp:Transcript_41188/g.106473  ORF Transcript_41188/g.106473 Transcript_41188/m.106473 type:complete len:239 (+) Transcript_41188:360-1076(+)